MTSDEIAGRIIQTAMAVASTPTTEERSFPGILAATRASFRPRRRQQSIQLQSSSKRGRKRKNNFQRKLFVSRLCNVVFLPAPYEQKYLSKRGLGVLPQQLTINRTWSWNQLKDEILNLLLPHIKNMIEMVGFDLARCDRQKQLKRLEYSDDDDLEGVLSSGMIIVIPRKDFPNDLPIIEEHNGNNSRSTNMTDNDFAPNERQIVPRRSLNLSLSSQTHPDILDDDFQPNERQIVPRRSLNMSLSRQTHPDILDDDFEQTQRQIVPRRSLNLTLSRRTHLNILEENNSNTNEDALSSNEDVEEHIDNTYNVDEQLEPYLSFPFIPEEAEVKFIEISRQDILGKMFELYNDNSLTSSRLLIKFIDEEGIDGGGLLSEMFTIFWRALFESGDFFIGNDVLIPYIKLEKEMEIMPKLAAIGRILGHMIMLTNKMPPRLALYTLHALSNKPDDYTDQEQLLLQDFLLFLSMPERKLVQKALKDFEKLTNNERNRLISLYTTYGLSNVLPTQENVRKHVLLVAKKTIIKNTIDLYQKIKEGLPKDIVEYLTNIPVDYAVNIWKSLQPTATKVANILQLQVPYPTDEQDKVFYFLQNYVLSLSTDMVERFLLFVTGGIQIPDSISVNFHEGIGIARRPVASTCSNLLKLSLGYENQRMKKVDPEIMYLKTLLLGSAWQ